LFSDMEKDLEWFANFYQELQILDTKIKNKKEQRSKEDPQN